VNSALIIDPHPAVRAALLKLLGRHGWQVEVVASPAAVAALLAQSAPSAIFYDPDADHGLPGSLLGAVRLPPAWRPTPLVSTRRPGGGAQSAAATAPQADDFLSGFSRSELTLLWLTALAQKVATAARAATPAGQLAERRFSPKPVADPRLLE
jgi:CheY-like chemotaxis protein